MTLALVAVECLFLISATFREFSLTSEGLNCGQKLTIDEGLEQGFPAHEPLKLLWFMRRFKGKFNSNLL